MEDCKIISWNVNGLRSPSMNLLTKEKPKKFNLESNLSKLLDIEDPDIICLCETKCQSKNEVELNSYIPFEYKIWNSSTEKLGYSGVCVWSKIPFKNMGQIEGLENDNQGRYLFLDFNMFYLINVYVPNTGGDKDKYRKNIWNPSIYNLLEKLKFENKPVIFCGDLNVVRDFKDIYNPEILKKGKSPGVKEYERNDFQKLLDLGYLDCMRYIDNNSNYWTWWDPRSKAREKDNGWRLDYFLISNGDLIKNSKIHKDIYGSDHCPISLEITF